MSAGTNLNAPGELPVPGVVIRQMRKHAFNHPWPGNAPLTCRRHYLDTTAITEPGRATRLLISFDQNYHGSGWFKNEQYEQCLHISISHPRFEQPKPFIDKPGHLGPVGEIHRGHDVETVSDEEARAWGWAFFQEHAPKSWFEPAASVGDAYRMPNIIHLRLYYTLDMQPFIPQGEPYTVLKPWSHKVRESVGGDVR